MSRNFIQLFACVWLISFASPVGVQAYTFDSNPPAVWPNGNVPMVLKLGSPGRTLIDGNTSWDTVAAEALTIWNSYIGTIQFMSSVQSPGAGSNRDRVNQAFFSSTVYGQAFGDALAITRSWLTGTTRTEADVIFNTAYPWDSYRGMDRVVQYTNSESSVSFIPDLRRVALHEFGHALGLSHPDEAGQSVNAIMNSHGSTNLNNLAPDDISGARALYPPRSGYLTITVLVNFLDAGAASGGGTFANGSTRTVKATANSGNTFANWTENGNVVSTSASYTFTLNSDRHLVANFKPVTLTINAENGWVIRSPDQSSYTPGTEVRLYAVPNANFQFTGWSGDLTGNTNPVVVTMNSNKTITANFATTSPLDFDGNGQTDLLWQQNDGHLAVWFMNRTNLSGSSTLNGGKVVDPKWKIVGANDFDGDHHSDILWQHANGSLAIWFMNGTKGTNLSSGITLNSQGTITSEWRVNGLADFNRTGSKGLVCRNNLNGKLSFWPMSGTNITGTITPLNNGLTISTNWQIAGFADFNGDGKTDIFWQSNEGLIYVWMMDGTTLSGSVPLNYGNKVDPKWRITALSDFNQDGRTDIIWRHSTGLISIWFMNGPSLLSSGYLNNGKPVDTSWKIVAPK